MAEHFAQKYAQLPWEAVYVSPMQRTQSTAKPFCQATGLDMQLRDGLKEMSFGEWENLTKEQVQEKFPDDYIRWLTGQDSHRLWYRIRGLVSRRTRRCEDNPRVDPCSPSS